MTRARSGPSASPTASAALASEATPAERRVALEELAYLLNDNVEVITAPPQPPV